MHLLALSGSLRRGSSNTILLEALAGVAPEGVAVELYTGLAELPPFNPDLDTGDERLLPPSVRDLRARIGASDGLLISTPEYAHGLPGSFKNALDWLVGSLEFPGKPVAVVMASSRAAYARAQLLEILSTMSASIVGEACATIEVPRGAERATELVDDSAIAPSLRGALDAFAAAVAPRAT